MVNNKTNHEMEIGKARNYNFIFFVFSSFRAFVINFFLFRKPSKIKNELPDEYEIYSFNQTIFY